LVPLPVRRDAGSSVTGLTDAILVAMGHWNPAQGAFVISRGAFLRPARSPDLSMCNYFRWGCLKFKVYLTKPSDIDKLKNAIKEKITAAPYRMVTKAMITLRDRLEQCREDGGIRLRGALFKNKICKDSDIVYFNCGFLIFYIKIQIIPNFKFLFKFGNDQVHVTHPVYTICEAKH
jgi:hypothetical protein